jgi:uncharacterized protein (UPF0332 family)
LIDKFEYYIKDGKVKKKTPDLVEARSLIERSNKRMQYIRELNDETAFLVLDDSYESAREATQALMSKNGFKPYSHEATLSFLKEFYSEYFSNYELIEFDRFRDLRNKAHYDGLVINYDDAAKCLKLAKDIINIIGMLMEK